MKTGFGHVVMGARYGVEVDFGSCEDGRERGLVVDTEIVSVV